MKKIEFEQLRNICGGKENKKMLDTYCDSALDASLVFCLLTPLWGAFVAGGKFACAILR